MLHLPCRLRPGPLQLRTAARRCLPSAALARLPGQLRPLAPLTPGFSGLSIYSQRTSIVAAAAKRGRPKKDPDAAPKPKKAPQERKPRKKRGEDKDAEEAADKHLNKEVLEQLRLRAQAEAEQRAALAAEVYAEDEEQDPRRYNFHRSLLSAAQRGLVDECARIISQMHDSGMPPGARAYHVWAYACVRRGDMEGAIAVLELATKAAGVTLLADTYIVIMYGWLNTVEPPNVREAENWYRLMQQADADPNKGLNFIAKELFRKRYSNAAMALLAEALTRDSAAAGAAAEGSEGGVSSGGVGKFEPEPQLAGFIIEQLCRRGLMQAATDQLEGLIARGFRPGPQQFNPIVRLEAALGNIKAARNWIQKTYYDNQYELPDVTTANALLAGVVSTIKPGEMSMRARETLENLFAAMQEELNALGIRPNRQWHAHLCEAFVKLGDADLALASFENMKAAGGNPSQIRPKYIVQLLELLSNSGRPVDLLRVLQTFMANDFKPPAATAQPLADEEQQQRSVLTAWLPARYQAMAQAKTPGGTNAGELLSQVLDEVEAEARQEVDGVLLGLGGCAIDEDGVWLTPSKMSADALRVELLVDIAASEAGKRGGDLGKGGSMGSVGTMVSRVYDGAFTVSSSGFNALTEDEVEMLTKRELTAAVKERRERLPSNIKDAMDMLVAQRKAQVDLGEALTSAQDMGKPKSTSVIKEIRVLQYSDWKLQRRRLIIRTQEIKRELGDEDLDIAEMDREEQLEESSKYLDQIMKEGVDEGTNLLIAEEGTFEGEDMAMDVLLDRPSALAADVGLGPEGPRRKKKGGADGGADGEGGGDEDAADMEDEDEEGEGEEADEGEAGDDEALPDVSATVAMTTDREEEEGQLALGMAMNIFDTRLLNRAAGMTVAVELVKAWSALGLSVTPADVEALLRGAVAERNAQAVATALALWNSALDGGADKATLAKLLEEAAHMCLSPEVCTSPRVASIADAVIDRMETSGFTVPSSLMDLLMLRLGGRERTRASMVLDEGDDDILGAALFGDAARDRQQEDDEEEYDEDEHYDNDEYEEGATAARQRAGKQTAVAVVEEEEEEHDPRYMRDPQDAMAAEDDMDATELAAAATAVAEEQRVITAAAETIETIRSRLAPAMEYVDADGNVVRERLSQELPVTDEEVEAVSEDGEVPEQTGEDWLAGTDLTADDVIEALSADISVLDAAVITAISGGTYSYEAARRITAPLDVEVTNPITLLSLRRMSVLGELAAKAEEEGRVPTEAEEHEALAAAGLAIGGTQEEEEQIINRMQQEIDAFQATMVAREARSLARKEALASGATLRDAALAGELAGLNALRQHCARLGRPLPPPGATTLAGAAAAMGGAYATSASDAEDAADYADEDDVLEGQDADDQSFTDMGVEEEGVEGGMEDGEEGDASLNLAGPSAAAEEEEQAARIEEARLSLLDELAGRDDGIDALGAVLAATLEDPEGAPDAADVDSIKAALRQQVAELRKGEDGQQEMPSIGGEAEQQLAEVISRMVRAGREQHQKVLQGNDDDESADEFEQQEDEFDEGEQEGTSGDGELDASIAEMPTPEEFEAAVSAYLEELAPGAAEEEERLAAMGGAPPVPRDVDDLDPEQKAQFKRELLTSFDLFTPEDIDEIMEADAEVEAARAAAMEELNAAMAEEEAATTDVEVEALAPTGDEDTDEDEDAALHDELQPDADDNLAEALLAMLADEDEKPELNMAAYAEFQTIVAVAADRFGDDFTEEQLLEVVHEWFMDEEHWGILTDADGNAVTNIKGLDDDDDDDDGGNVAGDEEEAAGASGSGAGAAVAAPPAPPPAGRKMRRGTSKQQ